MSWLSNLIKPHAISDSEMRGENAWLYDLGESSYQTSSGIRVTDDNFLSLSGVYAAARAISEDVAAMPLKVYRKLPQGGKEVASDEPKWLSEPLGFNVNLHKLLHKCSNPYMTNITYRSLLVWWATLYGNGIAEIKYDDARRPIAFYPIHPHIVDVEYNQEVGVWYDIREDRFGGKRRRLYSEDVIHIKGPSNDGIVGDLINKRAAEAYGIYLAAERTSASFFGRGATLAGLISFEQSFKTKEARQAYREEFNRQYTGASNAGRWMITDGNAKVQPFSVDPERAQMLDSIRFRIEDVARWFRVPPVILGHNTSTPYANIQPLGQFYYNFGLKPWAIRIEQEHDRKLIYDDDMFVEHVVDSLMWADPKTRTEVHAMRIRSGLATPNEAREVENMNPYEGGDRFRVEQNLALLNEDGEPEQANTPTESTAPNDSQDAEDSIGSTEETQAAMMPVFVDAAERLIRREARAYQSKKNPTPDWLDSFYVGHREAVVESIRPAATMAKKLLGSKTDINRLLSRYADMHVLESRRRLSEGEDPAAWIIDRPAWIARHLTDEVSNG